MNRRNSKWHARFISIAMEVSKWSKDPSTKVGAVLVSEHGDIISQGYNGFPRNVLDSDERYLDRDNKLKMIVHAEQNAIYNAARRGASTYGSTLYVCSLPICNECAKGIIQAGISSIYMPSTTNVYDKESRWYPSWSIAIRMFSESGVKVYTVDMESFSVSEVFPISTTLD